MKLFPPDNKNLNVVIAVFVGFLVVLAIMLVIGFVVLNGQEGTG